MPAPLPDLHNFSRPQLTAWIKELGLPGFRANQIFAWLWRPDFTNFAQMTNLSKDLRVQLNELATTTTLALHTCEKSKDGTSKYAWQLTDDNIIESVLIPDGKRRTLCISSQVGCAMGCAFCLTATMGFKRNLLASEIVGQVRAVQKELGQDERIHNLVFMGMGEPLANMEQLSTSLAILGDELGPNFSAKRITVSTCGLAPQLAHLGEMAKVNLAISLHAATDELRDRLMPINKTYAIADLMAACQKFPLAKRQKITIEYILLAGANDQKEDARNLARLLRPLACKINLLPCNEAPEIPFHRPTEATVLAFQDILQRAGYTVLIRSSRGADISAACGQLAARHNQPQ